MNDTMRRDAISRVGFSFNNTAPAEIYTSRNSLSLPDALAIS